MTDASKRLSRARRAARLLDEAFELPVVGRKIGIDGIVGLVPFLGDWVASMFSLYIVYEAYRAGVPTSTLLRMLVNISFDAAGGSIPVLGDIFDVAFKANTRNVELFERHVGVE